MSIAMMFQACQEDMILENEPPNPSAEEYLQEEGLTKTQLGEKLNNPYSVSNMKIAYDSLVKQNFRSNFTSDIISTTHYYLKFFVASAEDYDLLVADSLDLFEYPLDYEIESYGDYYTDGNENQEGKWYYTVVPKDYKFGTIEKEILEELFMEEGLSNDNERLSQKLEDFYYLLEDESLRLTGLLPKSNEGENLRMPSKKTPRGTLRVRNTETNGLDPVVGVKVKTRRLVKLGHGWTGSDGEYESNKSYRYDVHYSVSFENKSGFKVWNTLLDVNPAKFNGPKRSRTGWSYDFDTNSHGWRFATVTNAVVKYFDYCDQFNIGRPHSNLRIAATSKTDGVGAAPMLRHTWGLQGFSTHSQLANFFLKVNGTSFAANKLAIITKFAQPDIMINAGYSNDNETIEVYETTFHELAHASHMRKVGSSYWVKYINYIITYGDHIPGNDNGAYGDGTGHNVGVCAVGEAWGYHMGRRLAIEEFGNNNSFTPLNGFESFDPEEPGVGNDILSRTAVTNGPIVSWEGWIPAGIMHDLTDNNPDLVRTGFRDNVSGYTHQDLFDALDSDVRSPQQFRNRLLRENGNRDRTDVLNLFEAYFWD